MVEQNPQDLAQTMAALPYGGPRLDTGHYDADGNMIIYYSVNDESLSNVDRALSLLTNQFLGLPWETSLDIPSPVEESFLRATRTYEQALPIRFVPLREAPAGTKPDLILGMASQMNFGDEKAVAGMAHFPNEPHPMLWLNGEYYSKGILTGELLYGTILHEIGHTLGLKHPADSVINENMVTDSTAEPYSMMGRGNDIPLQIDARPGVYPLGDGLPVADRMVLQQIYGLPRGIVPSSLTTRDQVGSVAIIKDGDMLRFNAANAQLDSPINGDVDIDADGSVGVGSRRWGIPNANAITYWQGTDAEDYLSGSSRRGSVLEGGASNDTYYIRANGGFTTVKDSGDNLVALEEGAQVCLDYGTGQENRTRIAADFIVSRVEATRTETGDLQLSIYALGGKKPTIVIMPADDKAIRENNLMVEMDVSATDGPSSGNLVAVPLPAEFIRR